MAIKSNALTYLVLILTICLHSVEALANERKRLSPEQFYDYLEINQGANLNTSNHLSRAQLAKYPKLSMIFNDSDSVKKGHLSKNEFVATYKNYRKTFNRFFQKIDKNGDQHLSQLEVMLVSKELLPLFNKLDIDHNGRISRKELLRSPVFLSTKNKKNQSLETIADMHDAEFVQIQHVSDESKLVDDSLLNAQHWTQHQKNGCSEPGCTEEIEVVALPEEEEEDYFYDWIIIIIIIIDDNPGECSSAPLAEIVLKQGCPAPPVDRAKKLRECYEDADKDYDADILRCQVRYPDSDTRSRRDCYERAGEYYAESRSICRGQWG